MPCSTEFETSLGQHVCVLELASCLRLVDDAPLSVTVAPL